MNDEFGEDLDFYFDDDERDEYFGQAINQAIAESTSKSEKVDNDFSKPSTSKDITSGPSKPSICSASGSDGSEFNPGASLFYPGPEAEGFFLPTGNSFYYPTNFPVREYQKSIIETALFNNTLVVLPTGLGKTFIAAVVMYNFYRWYPRGLIVFMAPTRPLVAQQINACTDIMGIPLSDITELTGKSNKKQRIDSWKEKRVFFVTPHVMVNDITNNYCDPNRVRCIIIDEAHKATGNYSYCQVVRQLSDYFLKFRIVALSATPGNNVEAYQDVIKNLNIAKVQVRAEDSPDVAKYVHGRKLSHIVLKLDNTWKQFQDKFLQLYEDYSRVLKDHSIVRGNVSSLTAFQIMTLMDTFKKKKDVAQDVKNKCNMSLLACSTLAHAHSLLYTYGFKALYSHFSGESESCAMPMLLKNEKLRSLLRAIDDYLRDNGSPMNYVPSHPKFAKLREVVANHFSTTEQSDGKNDSKVIIYCQFRVGVTEAHCALKELEPLIRPVMFIGQSSGKKGGAGLGQRMQLDILNNFKSGKHNTLIATSIGEEGLDIGEVDLIICLDAQSSVTRHIQRIGRTGRKRAGACIFLVTEGKEEQKLLKCLTASSTFNKMINPNLLNTAVNGANPRMVPKHIKPQLHFVHIQPSKESPKKSKKASVEVKEIDDESGESSSKCVGKRKKAGNAEGEKKAKPSKKAKVEAKAPKPPNGRTLFNYFSKKTFESFSENDENNKSVFVTPKDKKIKLNAPELDDILEEECMIVEEDNLENQNVEPDIVFEPNAGSSFAVFDDVEVGDSSKTTSKDKTDSKDPLEMKKMLTLFQNWTLSYSQNKDLLFDENFVQLVRHFLRKPDNSVALDCDPVVNIYPRESSPSLSIDSIDFDFDDGSNSPIISPCEAKLKSSPVMLESDVASCRNEFNSPVLSCNKFRNRAMSPCNVNVKLNDNFGDHSPLISPNKNDLAGSTSTPKTSFNHSRRKHQNKTVFPNSLNQNQVQETFEKKLLTNGIHFSASENDISDSESTSPIILTCRMSKSKNNVGTSKKLFFEGTMEEATVPVSECTEQQTTEEHVSENPNEYLNDSFDMFLGDLEDDALASPKTIEHSNCLVDNSSVLKKESAPISQTNLKSEAAKAVAPTKLSSFSIDHSENSKRLASKKKNAMNLASNETIPSFQSKSTVSDNKVDCLAPRKRPGDSKTFASVDVGKNTTSGESMFKLSEKGHAFTNSKSLSKESKNEDVEVSKYFGSDESVFENLLTESSLKGCKAKVEASGDVPLDFDSKDSVGFRKPNYPEPKSDVSTFGLNNHKSPKKWEINNLESTLFKASMVPVASLSTKSNFRSKKPLLTGIDKSGNNSAFEDENKNKKTGSSVSITKFSNKKIDGKETNDCRILKNNVNKNEILNCLSESSASNFDKSKLITPSGNKPVPPVSPFKFFKSKSSNDLKENRDGSVGTTPIKKGSSQSDQRVFLFSSDSDDSDLFFDRPGPAKVKKMDERQFKYCATKGQHDSAPIKSKKQKKKRSDFINWEAEVSGSDVSEDENDEDEDGNLVADSFIQDGHSTVLHHESTMMGQYLESIKSPSNGPGGFKIPILPNRVLDMDVFSQTFNNDADYENDSFCVDEEISEGYECSEDEDAFTKSSRKAMGKSKKQSKRKRFVDSSSSNEEVVLINSSPEEGTSRIGSEVIYIGSGSSDEDNYTRKKPARRKATFSAKFSKFRKAIEAKKFKVKPRTDIFQGESSRTVNPISESSRVSCNFEARKENNDSDDDFLPKPSHSHLNKTSAKNTSCMDLSVIGNRVKKKVKLKLLSSDED